MNSIADGGIGGAWKAKLAGDGADTFDGDAAGVSLLLPQASANVATTGITSRRDTGTHGASIALWSVPFVGKRTTLPHGPRCIAPVCREPRIPCGVETGVVGIEVDEAALNQEVAHLEDIAP